MPTDGQRKNSVSDTKGGVSFRVFQLIGNGVFISRKAFGRTDTFYRGGKDEQG